MDQKLAMNELHQAEELLLLSESQLDFVAGGSGDVVFANKPGS